MVRIVMETISISKFKATCLAVLERVRKTGEPIQVTKFGKPVADVIPSVPKTGGLKLGYMLEGREVGTVEPEDSGWDNGDDEKSIREWDELNAEPAPPLTAPPSKRR